VGTQRRIGPDPAAGEPVETRAISPARPSSGGGGAASSSSASHGSSGSSESSGTGGGSGTAAPYSFSPTNSPANSSGSPSVYSAGVSTYRRDPDPADGEPVDSSPAQSTAGTPVTVTVQPGDTIWGYWKDHGRDREWQDYKQEFRANNAAILDDGWLHPGETAIVAIVPPVVSDPTDSEPDQLGPPQTPSAGTGASTGGSSPDPVLPEATPPETTSTTSPPPGSSTTVPGGVVPPVTAPPTPTATPVTTPTATPTTTTTAGPGTPRPAVTTTPSPPTGTTTVPATPGVVPAPGPGASSPIPTGTPSGPGYPQSTTGTGGLYDSWQGAIAPMLPQTANESLTTLFATNRAASVALKAFTPNLDTKWSKGKFGDYMTGGGNGKAHGWFAARGEAAVSASWINGQGVRMRSGTISITVSAQVELIGEVNIPQGDGRVLATDNTSATISYSITTTEDRLEDIMTGDVPAPNPFTLENMQPGDTISIYEGTGVSGELEGRVLAGKGPLRAGLDVKGDIYTQDGHKITVRMVANPDPAKQDEPHVIVMDGDRDSSGNAIGFGLIWNPKIAQNNTGLDKISQGNFARGLLQMRESDTQEHFNFIEINPFDTSPGGGADLYRKIMTEGVVEYDPARGEVPGAIADGTMTVDSEYDAATLQLTLYGEPRQKDRRNHVQGLMQYSIDLVAMIDDRSQMRIRYAEPTSVLGDTGDLIVNTRLSNGTSTNYFHRYRMDAANYKAEETFNLTAESVSREDVARALDTETFGTIRLHLKDGSVVEGQEAIDWLNSNKDGWFGGNDKVGVVVDMGTTLQADQFSADFVADQKKFHDDQQDNIVEKFFYWIGQGQQSSPEVAIASLAAPDVFANPDQPWNLDDHQSAQNADENFRAMSGSGMGNLLNSIDRYHEYACRADAYPISVDVYVDWD
jgi:hypothetical protein